MILIIIIMVYILLVNHYICTNTHTHTHIYIYLQRQFGNNYFHKYKKLATVVEGGPKTLFSMATTSRCKKGRYCFS